jgi:hypothetical protein
VNGPLGDDALLELARSYHDRRQHLKELEAEADVLKDALLAALEAREGGRLAHAGWRVARVVNERVSYPFDAATARWRPATMRRVTVRSIDKAKVAEEIDSGRLPVLDALAVRVVDTSAPYVRVTPPEPAASKAQVPNLKVA